jgi:hypothetical protein
MMILGQLELLSDYMKHICRQPEELDLEISQEQAMNAAERYLNKARNINITAGQQRIASPPVTSRKGVSGVRVVTSNNALPIERA